MEVKQSREELEHRLAEKEQEIASLLETIEELRESEEKFKTIFEMASDQIVYIAPDGTVIEANQAFEDVLGYKKRDEIIGHKFYETSALSPEDWQKTIKAAEELLTGKTAENGVFEFEAERTDGTKMFIEVKARAVVKGGEVKGVLTITRDVTARKRQQDELERLVRERTANLEEANTALRVLLEKAEEFKTEMGERILFNVREFVLPYLEKLKKTQMNEVQKAYLNSLEDNLNDIVSPFLKGISTRYMRLTPTEIQVANLVKQGKTTKEIADLLNMSIRTIETHRYRIRSKLGVRNHKVNLRTYLLSAG